MVKGKEDAARLFSGEVVGEMDSFFCEVRCDRPSP